MAKKLIIPSLIVIAFATFALIPYSGGSPGGKTGSISDSKTCTQCHMGTAVPVSDWITSSIPEEGYTPGETYSISIEGSHTGVSRFGFELTAEDVSGTKKGMFTITDASQTKLSNSNSSVTHTSSGNSPSDNKKSWSFNWTAPEAGSGDITLYAALNAANGNNSTSGDVIYTTNLPVLENNASGVHSIKAEENNYKVYQSLDPNNLVVDYSGDNKLSHIRIYDLTGSLLKSRKVASPDEQINMNIQELKSNIYLVQFQTDLKSHFKKILINK